MSEQDKSIFDLGSIDFTPDWARKSAGVSVGKIREVRGDESSAPGERKSFGDRKPFGDRKHFGERKPFGDRKPKGDRKPFGERKPFGDRGAGRGASAPARERLQPLDCEVKILPETKALGTIFRKLQQDTHAYKLKELAYFFLDNPESILLKITPKAPSQPSTSTSTSFFQCKACGFAALRQEDVISHIVAAHLGDYYDAKEVECEPPKGNFNCVAKCGLSGVLLGPPNIHEFNATVREMIRTRYPEMSEEQYRSHIEMVRDSESIEAWRAGATKKTVFFAKGQADVEGAAQLSREQAEGEFRRTILPSLVDSPKNLMITADVAMKSPVRQLQWLVRDAVEAERRAPYNICFALRGAFHHRKLKFFRANDARGPEFVMNVEPKPFDAEHAIPELAAVAKFVAEHPCCDKSEFPSDVADFEKHLGWLVSTGHVISFTNGVYSAVEKYPKYGPQWKKRSAQPVDAVSSPRPSEEGSPSPDAEGTPRLQDEAPVVAEETVVADAPVVDEAPVVEESEQK